MSTTTSPSYAQPALIGGIALGVLSALPLISLGNGCCCLWVVCGGAMAAYLLQQNTAAPITPGDGALVGLLAGLIGAVVTFAVSIPINILVGPMEREVVRRVLEMGTLPPEMRDMVERVSNNQARQFGPGFIALRLVGLVFWAIIAGIFSTIGGVLGALIFKKDTPPGVIDVPPTA